MVRFVIAVWLAPALFGQLATDVLSKAPPAVDEALRARIKEFYQYHVEGKFRLAEPLVAEDTKDFFYAADKPKYLDFEIRSIAYTDDFTKAKATLVCKMVVMMAGFANKPLPMPTTSRWKVVDGNWYFYVDQEELKKSPFGKMQSGSPGTPSAAAPAMPPLPSAREALGRLNAVKADKDAVRIDPTRPFTDHVTIRNHLPGSVSLTLSVPKLAGLEILLDKTALQSGEQAGVTIRYTPSKKGNAVIPGPAVAKVEVDPTGQVLPIRLEFAK